MYTTVMPSANQILHGSVGGLISHMEKENADGRISNPPNHNWGGEALIAAHTALYRSLESVSKALGATPDPGLEILREDHHAIWSADSAPGASPIRIIVRRPMVQSRFVRIRQAKPH